MEGDKRTNALIVSNPGPASWGAPQQTVPGLRSTIAHARLCWHPGYDPEPGTPTYPARVMFRDNCSCGKYDPLARKVSTRASVSRSQAGCPDLIDCTAAVPAACPIMKAAD